MTLRKLLTFCALLITSQALYAVTTSTSHGDSSFYETGTTTDAPWDSVIEAGSASGVYLGGGWVLTAEHEYSSSDSTTITPNGVDYSSDTSLISDLSDSDTYSDTPVVDLRLFRLDSVIEELDSISIGSVSARAHSILTPKQSP